MSKWPSRKLDKETREKFVEAELYAVSRTMEKLIPMVKRSNDEEMKRGFRTLLATTLPTRFEELEPYWIARHIGSGYRQPNLEHKKIRECAAKLLASDPRQWGLATKVKNATGTKLSKRQISRILKKNGT